VWRDRSTARHRSVPDGDGGRWVTGYLKVAPGSDDN
jgi:hypothetical protein